MSTDRSTELHRALTICYDTYPQQWVNRFPGIMAKLDTLPKVSDNKMPYVTYFLYVHSNESLNTIRFVDAFMSDKVFNAFVNACAGMEKEAGIMASVDFRNFKAEVEAFSNMEEAITNPHLEVSALYRYMAAMQEDYIFLVTQELQADAVKQLRTNPYRYYAYGEHYLPLMPITWGGL